MTNDPNNPPAFPAALADTQIPPRWPTPPQGMSLWHYFAGCALTGTGKNYTDKGEDLMAAAFARMSGKIADAMMEEHRKRFCDAALPPAAPPVASFATCMHLRCYKRMDGGLVCTQCGAVLRGPQS